MKFSDLFYDTYISDRGDEIRVPIWFVAQIKVRAWIAALRVKIAFSILGPNLFKSLASECPKCHAIVPWVGEGKKDA